MESASVETYKQAHTVTQEDHDSGLYTGVAVGDTIVFVIKETTTTLKEVVDVEGLPEVTEESVAPKKKATKGNKIVAVGEEEVIDGNDTGSTGADSVV